MIHIDQLLELHSWIVRKTGGANGLRDHGTLESAINRPFATFDGVDLYPTVIEKSAAVFESILINHPFIDGNKHTELFLMRVLLAEENLEIGPTEDEKYDFTIQVAEGKLNTVQISAWIRSNSAKI